MFSYVTFITPYGEIFRLKFLEDLFPGTPINKVYKCGLMYRIEDIRYPGHAGYCSLVWRQKQLL